MDFRARLVATIRALRPVLAEPGVLVVGSEVPNLLQMDLPAPVVISRDVDVGVSVEAHAAVKRRLDDLRGLRPSAEEPSVWIPEGDLLEVNFVGMDSRLRDTTEVRELEDARLPLLVFGALSLLEPAAPIDVEGFPVPVPRPAGLALEKLLTDRSGEKGDRDLLVALALLLPLDDAGRRELAARYRGLAAEERHVVRVNLAILSLMDAREGMPDPHPHRAAIERHLRALEREEPPA